VSVSDGVVSVTNTLTLVVQEVNLAPVWILQPDVEVDPLEEWVLQLAAVDADVPVQPLNYQLVEGPSGMNVSLSGLLRWVPELDSAPGAHPVTVLVSDSIASATNQFRVVVRAPPTVVELVDPRADPGGFRFVIQAASGVAFIVEKTSDFTRWTEVRRVTLSGASMEVEVPITETGIGEFFRVRRP
jgi:hypothetical protein